MEATSIRFEGTSGTSCSEKSFADKYAQTDYDSDFDWRKKEKRERKKLKKEKKKSHRSRSGTVDLGNASHDSLSAVSADQKSGHSVEKRQGNALINGSEARMKTPKECLFGTSIQDELAVNSASTTKNRLLPKDPDRWVPEAEEGEEPEVQDLGRKLGPTSMAPYLSRGPPYPPRVSGSGFHRERYYRGEYREEGDDGSWGHAHDDYYDMEEYEGATRRGGRIRGGPIGARGGSRGRGGEMDYRRSEYFHEGAAGPPPPFYYAERGRGGRGGVGGRLAGGWDPRHDEDYRRGGGRGRRGGRGREFPPSYYYDYDYDDSYGYEDGRVGDGVDYYEGGGDYIHRPRRAVAPAEDSENMNMMEVGKEKGKLLIKSEERKPSLQTSGTYSEEPHEYHPTSAESRKRRKSEENVDEYDKEWNKDHDSKSLDEIRYHRDKDRGSNNNSNNSNRNYDTIIADDRRQQPTDNFSESTSVNAAAMASVSTDKLPVSIPSTETMDYIKTTEPIMNINSSDGGSWKQQPPPLSNQSDQPISTTSHGDHPKTSTSQESSTTQLTSTLPSSLVSNQSSVFISYNTTTTTILSENNSNSNMEVDAPKTLVEETRKPFSAVLRQPLPPPTTTAHTSRSPSPPPSTSSHRVSPRTTATAKATYSGYFIRSSEFNDSDNDNNEEESTKEKVHNTTTTTTTMQSKSDRDRDRDKRSPPRRSSSREKAKQKRKKHSRDHDRDRDRHHSDKERDRDNNHTNNDYDYDYDEFNRDLFRGRGGKAREKDRTRFEDEGDYMSMTWITEKKGDKAKRRKAAANGATTTATSSTTTATTTTTTTSVSQPIPVATVSLTPIPNVFMTSPTTTVSMNPSFVVNNVTTTVPIVASATDNSLALAESVNTANVSSTVITTATTTTTMIPELLPAVDHSIATSSIPPLPVLPSTPTIALTSQSTVSEVTVITESTISQSTVSKVTTQSEMGDEETRFVLILNETVDDNDDSKLHQSQHGRVRDESNIELSVATGTGTEPKLIISESLVAENLHTPLSMPTTTTTESSSIPTVISQLPGDGKMEEERTEGSSSEPTLTTTTVVAPGTMTADGKLLVPTLGAMPTAPTLLPVAAGSTPEQQAAAAAEYQRYYMWYQQQQQQQYMQYYNQYYMMQQQQQQAPADPRATDPAMRRFYGLDDD